MNLVETDVNPINDLGKIAIDTVTGFSGTVVSVVFQMSGNVQYCVTPNVSEEGNTYPESVAIDKNVIVIDQADNGVTDRVIKTSSQTPAFAFGEKVRDIITGIKGIVTQRAVYISGCTFYCVENKKKNEWINQARLKSLGVGAVIESDKPTKVGQVNVSLR